MKEHCKIKIIPTEILSFNFSGGLTLRLYRWGARKCDVIWWDVMKSPFNNFYQFEILIIENTFFENLCLLALMYKDLKRFTL